MTFPYFSQPPPKATSDEVKDNHQTEGPIILRCAECQGDVQRMQYPPHDWVHCDDQLIIAPGQPPYQTSDHRVVLDVIDTTGGES